MSRLAGVLWHPRSTLSAVARTPVFGIAWAFVLAVWLVPAAWLLSTDVGHQALVDERVRVVEAFGGTMDDDQYAVLQASPPVSAYFISGSRLLLTPPLTLLVAGGLVALARINGAKLSFAAALAVTVHASLVLSVQQAVLVPVHYLSESITNPTTLGAVWPVFEDGSVGASLLGGVDVVGVWWLWLLALGLSAATAGPALRYLTWLVGVYLGVAGLVAIARAVAGGA